MLYVLNHSMEISMATIRMSVYSMQLFRQSNCSFERVILNFDGAMFENSRDGNSSELK